MSRQATWRFPLFRAGAFLLAMTMLAAACAPAAPPAAPTSAPKPTAATGAATTGAPATAAAPAATPAQAGPPVEVVIAQPADPPTLDPQKPGGPFGGNLAYNIFDTLAFFSPDGKVIPWLATEWSQVSEKQWRFKLKEGVKFHNGEDFDSASVKFTIDRMLEPGKVRQLYTFGVLDRAEVVDKYTIDIFTKAADPGLPNRMTDLFALPPKYTVEAGEDGFGQKPVGTGPYRFVELLPNQRVTLESNKDYWHGAPSVTKLTFRTIPEASTRMAELLNGGVDLIVDLTPEQAATLKSNPRARAETLQSKRVPYIGLNLLEAGPAELKDKRVRQALNYAVDVDTIIKSVLSGYGQRTATIFRPDFPGYDSSITPYSYDPAKAKQLLAEAGYPNGFSIKMQTSSGIILKGLEISQAIASQLSQVGVNTEVLPLELNAFRQVVIGGQAQNKVEGLFLWNWGAKPGEGDSALSGFLHSKGVSSYWNNPTFDKMVEDARQETDKAKQNAAYKAIQQMLKEEAPVIFLYQAADLYGVSSRLEWKPRLDQYILGTDMTVKAR